MKFPLAPMEKLVQVIADCSSVKLGSHAAHLSVDIETETLVVSEVISKSRRRIYELSLNDLLFANPKSDSYMAHLGFMAPPKSVRKEFTAGCLFATCNRKRTKTPLTDRAFVELTLELHTAEDRDIFLNSLNEAVFGSTLVEPSRALVVINPVAGKGSAKSDWTKSVEPLLRLSGKFKIVKILFTERAGHAYSIGADMLGGAELDFEYLITLGGDGILFELLNGLFKACPDKYSEILSNIVLAPLPSGSGNGVSFSFLCSSGEPFTMNSALRQLIRRKICDKDLGIVHYQSTEDEFQGTSSSRLFALTISWGLVADVDIHSEFLRKYVGDARFTLYGLVQVMKKRQYQGHIRWANGNDGDHETEPDYITVYASLVPVAGRTVILNPNKPLNDGTIDIYRLRWRDVGRIGLIRAMDELAIRRDHQKYIKGFDAIHAKNFELSADETPQSTGGAGIVVDGEKITSGPVRVEVLPRATKCLSG